MTNFNLNEEKYLKDNLEVFSFSTDKIEVKSINGEDHVQGYISTFDEDLVGDIVTKNCMVDMASQMSERSMKVDFEHETWRGKNDLDKKINKTINPIARFVDYKEDDIGLWTDAILNKSHPRYDEAKGSLIGGFLDAYSIAYFPERTRDVVVNGKTKRLLDKVTLLNVAFTGNAINPNAQIQKVMAKSLDFLKNKEDISMENKELKNMEKQVEELKTQTADKDKELKTAQDKIDALEKSNKELTEAKDKVEAESKAKKLTPEEKAAAEKKTAEEKAAKDAETEAGKKEISEMKSKLDTMTKDWEEFKAKPVYKSLIDQNGDKLGVKGKPETTGPLDMIQ